MEQHIFSSNKSHFIFEVVSTFFIFLLVACTQEKPATIGAVVIEPKSSQHIDIFQPVQIANQTKQSVKTLDLKLSGILINSSGNNFAVISIGVLGQSSIYRVGDEVSKGISIISISNEDVVVSDHGNNYRIAMAHPIKNEQNSSGNLSQSKVTSDTTSAPLPAGMVPMSPNVDTQPSANNEFREMINKRFPK